MRTPCQVHPSREQRQAVRAQSNSLYLEVSFLTKVGAASKADHIDQSSALFARLTLFSSSTVHSCLVRLVVAMSRSRRASRSTPTPRRGAATPLTSTSRLSSLMADMEDDVSRLTIVSTPSPTVVAEAESRAGLGSSSGVLVQPPSRSGSTSLRYSSGGSQASTARRLLTSPAPARLSAGSGGLMGGSFGDGDVYEQPNPLDPGKAFRLVNLRKADQGRTVCLRMVGKWKVCLNPVQKGKRHCLNHSTSKSYVFGSPSEWHTVAKPQRGTSGRSAFCLPRVHDNTILPGFRELVEEDSQTMAEWKLSFAEMEVAYEEHMAS